ncbi:AEC family transporter, partial [Pseudoglutamicibacter cumminsii]|nr:AEC family transporter [Pseudoglutamicibacter cumminsii]
MLPELAGIQATGFQLFHTIARADVAVIFGPQVFIAAFSAFTVMTLYVLIARFALKRRSAELTVGALSAGMVNSAKLG